MELDLQSIGSSPDLQGGLIHARKKMVPIAFGTSWG